MFIAHSVRDMRDPPPVTLLASSALLWTKWRELGHKAGITGNIDDVKDYDNAQYGFQMESARAPHRMHRRIVTSGDFFSEDRPFKPHWDGRPPGPPDPNDPLPPDINNTSPIDALIMAVKPAAVVPRLLGIQHRFGPESTILLVHPGLGVLEELVDYVFPDPERRPRLIQGHSTHRLYPKEGETFAFTCSKRGSLATSPLPRFNKTLFEAAAFAEALDEAPSTKYLLNTLKRCSILLTNSTSVTNLYLAQIEQLVLDSVLQPMAALADCALGQLIYNYHFAITMRLLLTEISLVIRSLPELKSYSNLETRFAPDRLEKLILEKCYQHSSDLSPMAWDVRRGHGTQIDYLNGWIVKRGEELGLKCWMNYLTLNMVKGKALAIRHERASDIPLDSESKVY